MKSDSILVGLVADTHCEEEGASDLAEGVLDALRGVDLILHAGDLMTTGVLDRLAAVAPVVAVRSASDPPAEAHVALKEPPIAVQIGDSWLGLVSRPSDLVGGDDVSAIQTIARDRLKIFAHEVEFVVCRGAHRDRIFATNGVVFLDPGSPQMWAGPRASVMTVKLDSCVGTVSVIDVTGRIGWRRRLARHRSVRRYERWNHQVVATPR